MHESIANLFVNGGSQAVRLPKAFRFDGVSEVLLKKVGDSVILTPRKRAPIRRMIDALGRFEKFPEREQPGTAGGREKRQVRSIVKASEFKIMAV